MSAPGAIARASSALLKLRLRLSKDDGAAGGPGAGASTPSPGLPGGDLSISDLATGGGAKAPEQAAPKKPKPPVVKSVDHQGIPVSIDRPRGTVQSGVDDRGEPWSRTYHVDYGFIPGTSGGDGEGLDVYLGANAQAPNAYWVHQKTKAGPGLEPRFDEYKLMLGFDSPESAKAMYLAHTPKEHFGKMTETSVDMVKALLGLHPQDAVKRAVATIVGAEKKAYLDAFAKGSFSLEAWKGATELVPSLQLAFAPLERDFAPLAIADAGKTPRGDDAVGNDDAFSPDADDEYKQKRAVEKTIRHEGGKWVLYNHDGSKKLGTYDSKEEAVRGLRNAEGHKKRQGASPNAPFDPIAQMREAGPPNEWSGAVASFFTPDQRQAMARAWKEAPEAVRADIMRNFEEQFKNVRVAKAEMRKDAVTELRYVLGIVLEPDVVDSQGDTYDAETIRRAAWDYMCRMQNVGLMHKGLVNGKVDLVECWIAPVAMNVNGTSIKPGTWMIGMRCNDDAIWSDVKSGKLTGLSIGGFARKIPV